MAFLRLSIAGLTLIGLAACADEHAPVAQDLPCPPFVNYPKDTHSNDGSAYLGCTNRANLEEMVEDKHDLVAGKALGPADGARESKAVKDYQEGKTKISSGGGSMGNPAILLQGTGNTGTGQQ